MSAPARSLVVGFRVMGAAMARALKSRGLDVVAVDDHPSPESVTEAELLGVELLAAPSPDELARLVGDVGAVLPSPGIPDRHAVFELALRRDVPVLSEYDLAREWDERPIAAVTGTDGKTTVTTLVDRMLQASGVASVACGNNDLPLVDAIDLVEPDVFVVEASSFQLGHTQRFEPGVATWLNFAPDHLDVHASLESYEAAKARIWATLPEDGVAVANADDQVVRAHVPDSCEVVTFADEGRYRLRDGVLEADGQPLLRVDELARSLPHDVDNALAAAATARAAGATVEGVVETLRTFRGLPHRVELVGTWHGVAWYDDSKATVPHATSAAVRGFDDVVLIAGGRNKGLDLSPLRAELARIRAVVAIGEARAEVASLFGADVPVREVGTDMADAVASAADLAKPGHTVLLSPGCASFDWFGSYGERGDCFQAAVRRHHQAEEADG